AYRFGLVLGKVNKENRSVIFSVSVLIGVLLTQYFATYALNFDNISISSNDAIFSLIVFVPFLFLIRNKKLMFTLCFLVVVCTILSQKRSAIVFANIGILFGLCLYYIR